MIPSANYHGPDKRQEENFDRLSGEEGLVQSVPGNHQGGSSLSGHCIAETGLNTKAIQMTQQGPVFRAYHRFMLVD